MILFNFQNLLVVWKYIRYNWKFCAVINIYEITFVNVTIKNGSGENFLGNLANTQCVSRKMHQYGLSVNVRVWSGACTVKCGTELAGRARRGVRRARRARRAARWASCRRTCASRSTRPWARPSPTPPSTSSAPPSPDSSKHTALVSRLTPPLGPVVTSPSATYCDVTTPLCYRDARVTCDVRTNSFRFFSALRFCDVTLVCSNDRLSIIFSRRTLWFEVDETTVPVECEPIVSCLKRFMF